MKDLSLEDKKSIVWDNLKDYSPTYLATLCLAMMTTKDIEVAYQDMKLKSKKK